MTSAVETLEPTKVKLTVDIPAEDLAPAISAAYTQISKEIQVPGFRKGKVPPRIIDQRIGFDSVLDYAIRSSIDQWYTQAVRAEGIHPLGTPEIEITSQPDSGDHDQSLIFTAEVEVRPAIVLPDVESLTVTLPSAEVDDDDIDRGLTALRERFGTLRGVDRPAANGDFVSMNLTATVGDQQVDSVSGISYQLGEGTMLDGLDEALDGLSADEATTFEAPLAGGAHAGVTALIEVTVKSVKERELPDLDDDFAQLASEFDTVDELRADMAKRLVHVKRLQQLGQARGALVEALMDGLDIPVPAGLLASAVEMEKEQSGDGQDLEELEAEIARGLRSDMVLDTLSDSLAVEVSQEDLVNYLVEAAQREGADPSEFVEQAQAHGRMSAYIGDIARSKAISAALLKARVLDEAGEAVDFSDLLAQQPAEHDLDDDIEFDEE